MASEGVLREIKRRRQRHDKIKALRERLAHERDTKVRARLIAKISGNEKEIATPPNTLVVFEGAHVHHMVSPILAGERRLVLSMTYCTDPRDHLWQAVARRIKDTAFIGVRALWT